MLNIAFSFSFYNKNSAASENNDSYYIQYGA